jgi:hypothetical protein
LTQVDEVLEVEAEVSLVAMIMVKATVIATVAALQSGL